MASSSRSPSPAYLPKILCLHGGGTSAAIFQAQTLRLRRLLQTRFEFVFVDAPVVSPAGPGVLPVFEGCGPYLSWEREVEKGEEALAVEDREREEQARCAVLEKMLRQHLAGGEARFVGVLAFSQGTKVATALLAHRWLDLKFGVLLNGNFPVLPLNRWRDGVLLAKSDEPLTLGDDCKIAVPTLHVHGLADPLLAQSRELLDVSYDAASAVLLEFDIGHHMPTLQRDIRRLAAAIIRISAEV